MTFNIMVPVTIADANFDASNVPETDYTAWSSATAYGVGDRVIITGTTHLIYECLIAHTNKSPLVTANLYPAVGAFWITVGATNRWRPFDKKLSSLTTKSGDIAYRLLMTAALVDTVAFFGVTGGSVQVIVYNTDVTRRNLLTYSEEFGNADWTYTRSAVSENGVQDPWGAYQADAWFEDGTVAATHFKEYLSYSFTNALVYRWSIYAKRRTGLGNRDIRIDFPVAAFSGSPTALFDMGTGTVTSTSGGMSATVAPIDAYGYYRISCNATATATAAGQVRSYIYNGALSYNGNSVAGFNISSAQWEIGALTAYQWIRSAAIFGDLSYNSTQNKSVLLGGNSAEAVFRNVGADVGDYVSFAVYASGGTAQLGEVAMGISYPIGDMTGLAPSLLDYTSKTLDPYGNATIVPRNFAKRADYIVAMDKESAAQIINFLAALRSVPVVWYDTDDANGNWGSMVYGFYNEFSIPLTSGVKTFMALRAEGMV